MMQTPRKQVLAALATTVCLSGCIPEKEAEVRTYNFKAPVKLSACTSTDYLESLIERVSEADYLTALNAASHFSRTKACPILQETSKIEAELVEGRVSDSGVVLHMVSYKIAGINDRHYSFLINRNGLSEDNWEQVVDATMRRRAEEELVDMFKELFR